MKRSRRMTLQLTPLLDLLLIVIFAQYMEVRIVAKQESDRITAARESTSVENEDLRRQVDQWESAQRSIDRNRQREREQIGQIIGELFHIPDNTLNKIIQPRSKNEASGLSPTEIADLKTRMQQLAKSDGEQVVDHLLTFNEMRKQFEIWEFYLDENGSLLITLGQDRQQIKTKTIDSPEAFVDVVLQLKNQYPTSKDHVLLLCSYGDARLSHRLSMTRGLPAIAERLRQDGQGSQIFEYAVFGYRPQRELRPSADTKNR